MEKSVKAYLETEKVDLVVATATLKTKDYFPWLSACLKISFFK